ncbi:flagellar basal body rod protein FlgB [Bacillaceae bacterium SIJ1]|uniref:flagellar basal body rod protein FlgB n=1 Tax=Litoribacterium kuwaitense TaxID=1398745 RepID=UPI0013ED0240|nr:flagellar basal body rod protein FlgB [Litoribacterium kuwaitense]NGP44132.1 flagellar basal body rod protein FlgB [Litoribacterium kuwaitense]
MSLLASSTITALEKSVGFAQMKQNVIAQNISNADTPGYKERSISFRDTLHNAQESLVAKKTNAAHIPFSKETNTPYLIQSKQTSYHHNGNAVDIDKQMAMMAENQMHYYALVDRLNGKYQSLRSVIKGGQA